MKFIATPLGRVVWSKLHQAWYILSKRPWNPYDLKYGLVDRAIYIGCKYTDSEGNHTIAPDDFYKKYETWYPNDPDRKIYSVHPLSIKDRKVKPEIQTAMFFKDLQEALAFLPEAYQYCQTHYNYLA